MEVSGCAQVYCIQMQINNQAALAVCCRNSFISNFLLQTQKMVGVTSQLWSSACFVWYTEVYNASNCNPGCKSRLWSIAPSGHCGASIWQQRPFGPQGKGRVESAAQQNSTEWFMSKPYWHQLHRQSLFCIGGGTLAAAGPATKQRQRQHFGAWPATDQNWIWLSFPQMSSVSIKEIPNLGLWINRAWEVLVPCVLKPNLLC